MKKISLSTSLLSVVLLVVSSSAFSGQTFQHQGPPPQLIELYTSEGCSSCPPADRYLSKLVDSPNLWTQIIPMAFHVDYWDYIGWPDRFADPAFKERQYDYRRKGKLRSVYTPGLIVDGKEWRGFFSNRALPEQPSQTAGVLKASLTNNLVSINYQPQITNQQLTAHIAVLGFDLNSQVTAGENQGRRLEHQFVVLQKQQETRDNFTWSFQLENIDLSNRHALAIWITQPDLEIVQAVAGWIDNSSLN